LVETHDYLVYIINSGEISALSRMCSGLSGKVRCFSCPALWKQFFFDQKPFYRDGF